MALAADPTGAKAALKTWLLENNAVTVDPADVATYSRASNSQDRPWRTDPHHFKKCRISAIALIKMVMHARRGGHLEVMGMMQGKVDGDTMGVLDAFPLPVEGTETRVNAGNEAMEYMVQYNQASQDAGRVEHIVGCAFSLFPSCSLRSYLT